MIKVDVGKQDVTVEGTGGELLCDLACAVYAVIKIMKKHNVPDSFIRDEISKDVERSFNIVKNGVPKEKLS